MHGRSSDAHLPATDRPLAVYLDVDDLELGPGIAMLEAAGFRVEVGSSDDFHFLARFAADVVALLVDFTRVDQSLLERFPELGVVALASQGHDNVDLAACARAGIQVACLPPRASEEVAVHAWALTLAVVRELHFFNRTARDAATWNARPRFKPRRLSTLDVGIVGTGRTAELYADLASAHVRSVRSWSASGRSLRGASAVRELHELLASSDVVSIHIPLKPESHGLVDDGFLSRMRPHSYLINVARGGLVDSHALARALDSGRLAGVALDVLDQEPALPGHPLARRHDVLLSPHVAWLSDESERAYAIEPAGNVAAWLQTGAVNDPVIATATGVDGAT